MELKNIYFVGIGGIGMSALARYFLHQGRKVGGYDRTPSSLTKELEQQGADIHYEDQLALIDPAFLDKEHTTVIYTPAIPNDMGELQYFMQSGHQVLKRSQMLGLLAEGKYVMAVSGTHGKTSTSTLISWLNSQMLGAGCAFLGGISKNFNSNLVLGEGDRLTVEADEFDRSFLRLYPNVAIITSVDPDHLDIYGTYEAVKEAFSTFASQIVEGGALIIKEGVDIALPSSGIDIWRYSYATPCHFYASRSELQEGGYYSFDVTTPSGVIRNCCLGIPGWVNVENAIAAIAAMWCAAQKEGVALDEDKLRAALSSFEGVKRRFEFYINTPKQVYMDDYAHHPREIAAALTSVQAMFPERKITAIFQPHLYTRTRDLHVEFAEALSYAESVILMPIYPAREEPIEGVNAEMIVQRVTSPCEIVEREKIAERLLERPSDVVISFGAGNIDACCDTIAAALNGRA